MDDLGGKPTIFGNTLIFIKSCQKRPLGEMNLPWIFRWFIAARIFWWYFYWPCLWTYRYGYLGNIQPSKEKRAPVCSGYIGDEKLPSYVGIVIHHYEDPGSLLNHQYFMESIRVFVFSWLTVSFRGLNQSLLNATEQTSFFPRFFRRWHFVEQAAKGGKISQFGYLSYP